VGVGDVVGVSSMAFSLARSSHFPLTASRLLATRWPGVHRLVAAEEEEDPVGLEVNMLPLDWEPVRERDPLDVDEVRSSSLV
jgi:hypothetical protein